MSANQPPETNPQQGAGQQPEPADVPEFGPDGQPTQAGSAEQPSAEQPTGFNPQQGDAGQATEYPTGQPQGEPNVAGSYAQGDPNAAAGYPGAGYPQGDPNQPQGFPQGDPNQPQGFPQGDPNQPQGFPPAGGVPPAGGAFVPPGQEQPKKGGVGKRLISAVVAIVVALGVGFAVRSGIFDSKMAVGDCLQQTGEDSVKVVGCDSSDAQYKILGVKEKMSKVAAQAGACNDWPDTTSIYWEGRNTSSGTIYCLQKL